MKRTIEGGLFALVVVSLACAQSPRQAPQPAMPAASLFVIQDAGASQSPDIKGAFPATLEKNLDSKNLKEGDTVVCKTAVALHARSGLMIPSGATIIGHITQSQARAKGASASSLAMVFDKIEVAKGKEIPMKGTLQAIGPSLGDRGPYVGAAEPGSLNGAGRGDSGGGSTTPPPSSSMPMSSSSSGTPILLSSSHGVVGIKHLELDKDGVITSPGKEVKLDHGTQLMIYAEIAIPVQ